ncbi:MULTISPECIES: TRAP transporter large permease [Stappia]|uniref:TRAP transporter large permease protein n=1 Tax=Stappia taiwanensis TaxID=992267 RepID=A0A838Y493_9HYPH|nr:MULTISPECIES: TRAP transporter large permease [Stappia]MBA4613680.1 TRAP transporter large permease [Stappia taiwanensis]MCA1296814.1 TRAP transporter large permease [Stappia indica]GGE81474.1 C4-dicarboxylate ABC transporter [Stappia taiwanensis]
MDSITLVYWALGALLVLLALRVPVAAALGLVAIVGIYILMGERATWGVLRSVPHAFAAHWSLSAIPMFLFMGYICFSAGLTDGLFRVARAWLTFLPGGLAISSVGGAALFSSVTGSSVACAAAMGKIAVPAMLERGYDPKLAVGTIAAAGTMGSLIPPSTILLLYAVFAEVPVSELFIGAVIPGLLTAVMYSAMILLRVRYNPALAPRETAVDWRERFVSLGQTWPLFLLIVTVFGGIFGGLFSATEAGAIGALVSILIGFAKKTLSWKALVQAALETIRSTSAIFLIAVAAALLTRLFAFAGFPDYVQGLIGDDLSPLTIILAVSLIYLLLGMFLDPIGVMLLTLPVLLPIFDNAGISLIYAGVIITKYLEIGLITPPVGLNVFVIKNVVSGKVSTSDVFRGVGWFLLADVVTVAILIAFPATVLWLPELIRG